MMEQEKSNEEANPESEFLCLDRLMSEKRFFMEVHKPRK